MNINIKTWRAMAIAFFILFCTVLLSVSTLLNINNDLIEMNTQLLNTLDSINSGVKANYQRPDTPNNGQIFIEDNIV